MANIIKDFIARSVMNYMGANQFNKAFYQLLGGGHTRYDNNNTTYLEKGYNINPDVYAIINKQSVKTVSVPYYVKKVNDKKAFNELNQFKLATKGDLSLNQFVKQIKLETKAFSDETLPFPLENPNPTQTWSDIFALCKTYLKITGNVYIYFVTPTDGMNKGAPMLVYVLPSHLIEIVLKNGANMLNDENPIDKYLLTEGNSYAEFQDENIIHIKYANPNFDMLGSHLYGHSPLRSALRNLNSQNSGIDNNIKMMQNAGAYGFLFGKGNPLTQSQADSLKEKLIELDNDSSRLGKIGASSAEIGFQRIALTTDELKPFEYMQWDRNTICNVLNYPKELLGEKTGGALSRSDSQDARKELITNDIQPDLILIQEALNKNFIKRFKGYEDAVIEWDVSELPEMQEDMAKMIEWLDKLPMTPNEMRTAFKYETLADDGMDTVWINNGKTRVDDVSAGMFDNVNKQ
jgi:HK97 family phage portal protein